MAIATQWVATCTTVTTSSSSVYTTVAATVSSYLRDLVINNGGTYPCVVSLGTAATIAVGTASTYLPPGGTFVLTQCQIPNGAKIFGLGIGGTTTVNVGYATNVAYI